MILSLYRALTTAASPAIRAYLARRAYAGKEDPARMSERYGQASANRPEGRLVWIHAASVGESLSMLSLIHRLAADWPELNLMMTTGTVTSARILTARLPERVIHQFVPLDRGRWVRRFLDHWRPDLVLWVESDFWPNLLCEIGARGIPSVLVNARISPKSYDGWRRWPGLIGQLLDNFELCLAQTDDDARKLEGLGAARVVCRGNLKFSSAPLPVDDIELRDLRQEIGDRPAWLAASTHPGEETVIADAHRRIRATRRDALAIIVPRHPARGPAIADELRADGSVVRLRSTEEPVTGDADFYIADSMGELGLFYRLADAAFIGGSLIPHGGQNPLEAARLGCAIVHGPHMTNFTAIVDELDAAGATIEAASSEAIARAVGRLIDEPAERARRVAAARDVAATKAGILDDVIGELAPFIQPLMNGAAETDAGA